MDNSSYNLNILFKRIRNQFLAACLAYAILAIGAFVAISQFGLTDTKFIIGCVVIVILTVVTIVAFFKLHKNTEANEIINNLENQVKEEKLRNVRGKITNEVGAFMINFGENMDVQIVEKQRRAFVVEYLEQVLSQRVEQLRYDKETEIASWIEEISTIPAQEKKRIDSLKIVPKKS